MISHDSFNVKIFNIFWAWNSQSELQHFHARDHDDDNVYKFLTVGKHWREMKISNITRGWFTLSENRGKIVYSQTIIPKLILLRSPFLKRAF